MASLTSRYAFGAAIFLTLYIALPTLLAKQGNLNVTSDQVSAVDQLESVDGTDGAGKQNYTAKKKFNQ